MNKFARWKPSGFALALLALPGADPVHKVSVIPRGIGALGHTVQRPTEDRFVMTRQEMERKMAAPLGGRATEMLVFREPPTGAAVGLAKATGIARALVLRHGMNERLGPVADEENDGDPLLPTGAAALGRPAARRCSDETARAIDCAVREAVALAAPIGPERPPTHEPEPTCSMTA